MAHVTPRQWQGKWVVDFRPAGFPGRRVLPVPGGATEIEAIHAAYALLHRLEAERAAPAQAPQPPTLPGLGVDRETLFRFAVDEWLRRRQWQTRGGEAWTRQYAATVREELGARRMLEFEPPAGSDLLLEYVRGLRADFSPRSRRNRLSVIGQVLRFALEHGWLVALPRMPKALEAGESFADGNASYRRITEPHFRLVRAGVDARHVRAPGLKTAAAREDHAGRRRLYLSFGFYTGMHTANLDGLTADDLSVDVGLYLRTNSKSSRYIRPDWFEMPEQLALDVAEELERLGRPFAAGEAICGGPWPTVTKVISRICRRLGLPPANLRTDFRHATAYEYALRGWSERDISEIMGHVDQEMIRTIYLRVPAGLRSPVKIPWTVAPVPTVLRKVLPFQGRREETGE